VHAALAALQNTDLINSPSPNWGINAMLGNNYYDSASRRFINFTSPGSRKSTKKICIIDSGYDVTHPFLAPRESINVTGDGDWTRDMCGHGTAAAGIIAAQPPSG
jgi:hypothetical protein